jgi:hypothetical protein
MSFLLQAAAMWSARAAPCAPGAETGAVVTVVQDGRLVFDLHGGWQDVDRTSEWSPIVIWSSAELSPAQA